MAGTVIADVIQAASTSQLNIKNGVALTPPTISDVNNVAIGTFCRAWVNFNGSGTVAIRASFNVSSITDNSVGLYGINFTNAMPDVNYCANATASRSDVSTQLESICSFYTYAVGSVQLITQGGTGIDVDSQFVNVSIFR